MSSIAIFALSLSLSVGKSMTKEEMRQAAEKMVTECKGKVGASETDVETIKKHKMPETKEGLCLLECVFDSSKIMSDGKFSKDGFISAFSLPIQDNEEKLNGVKKLGETCKKEIGNGNSDKCETAKMIVECMVSNAGSHGFDIPQPGK